MQSLTDGKRFRELMPQAAAFYARMAELTGRDHVAACLKAGMALRRALDADDFAQVGTLYRQWRGQGIEPAHAKESGWQLGAAVAEVRGFAARHRAWQKEFSGVIGK